VCCSPKGEEQTLVYYDAVEKKLKVDTRKSSLTEGQRGTRPAGWNSRPASCPVPRVRRQIGGRGVSQRRQAVMRAYIRRDSVGVSLPRGPARGTLDAREMMPSNAY
jgi:hypothetical protein